jgi:hypothetical protein
MRRPRYVDDSLAVLRWEPLSEVRALYEKVKEVVFP